MVSHYKGLEEGGEPILGVDQSQDLGLGRLSLEKPTGYINVDGYDIQVRTRLSCVSSGF